MGASISSTIDIGDNRWQASIGWIEPPPAPQFYVLALIWGFGGALLISLIFIINQTHSRVDWLTAAVEAKTADLAASEERYRSLVEAADTPILLVDMEGRVLFRNKAFYTSLGFEEDEDIEMDRFARVHPDDIRIIEQQMPELLASGSVTLVEYRVRHKDGHWVFRDARCTLLRDASGKPHSVLIFAHDISKRKQLEEQREALENQYMQAQKMEAVGQLTAGIAHDFNNLLMGITGNAQLLQLQLPADGPLHAKAEVILQTGLRAADLVRQLLIFSRKQVSAPQIVELNKIISGTVGMLDRIIAENITVELKLAPDLWNVKIDPAQIEQVLVNLAINARDAMPDGGQLTFATTNTELDESDFARGLEAPPGEYVKLEVIDTGIGMDQQVRTRLFEPFFTTKELGHGTGLGLATAYGIVKQSGGLIEVHSEVGRGSTFRIYLPRTTEIGLPVSAPINQTMKQGHETVLLVEDDEAIRAVARDVLKEQGYAVLEAKDGRTAVQMVVHHPGLIDLLLTDVIMPGMSGRALAEDLVQRYPQLKVIYMSGYDDEVISHHGMLEPGINLLQKPFSVFDMVQKVQEVLG